MRARSSSLELAASSVQLNANLCVHAGAEFVRSGSFLELMLTHVLLLPKTNTLFSIFQNVGNRYKDIIFYFSKVGNNLLVLKCHF